MHAVRTRDVKQRPGAPDEAAEYVPLPILSCPPLKQLPVSKLREDWRENSEINFLWAGRYKYWCATPHPLHQSIHPSTRRAAQWIHMCTGRRPEVSMASSRPTAALSLLGEEAAGEGGRHRRHRGWRAAAFIIGLSRLTASFSFMHMHILQLFSFAIFSTVSSIISGSCIESLLLKG
jgi:hypothetical protein